ncbi:uncharacterized protein LOC143857185 [Tasmannia lanceolata]|uniref:uncharacterized protein LOC143857185 n=1 Tax=Tasmannia lanceolata TaxID=3420 RepID=UPI0040639348
MAKRSHKCYARYEKVQLGCMWGLISIFDFRHGRFTRRLTSDSKRGNVRHGTGVGHSRRRHTLLTNFDEKHHGIHHLSDNDESKGTKVECCNTSIKALMDEEMSIVKSSKKQIPTPVVEHIRPDSEHKDWSEKNHRQMNKTRKVVFNQHRHDLRDAVRLEPHQTDQENSTEIFSAMVEFYSQNYPFQDVHQDHKNRSDSIQAQKSKSHMKGNRPKGNLGNPMEAFLNRKFVDEKLLNGHGALHQSKEFMDALEILNSNKELFLELLQDPNSLVLQHIQDLRNDQAEKLSKVEEEIRDPRKYEEVVSHKHSRKANIHNLFRRKDKPQGNNPSNRIVVLKPGPASLQNPTTVTSASSSTRSQYTFGDREKSERVTSQFSLREIKKKLKNAIGESRMEQHLISEENVETDLASKNSCQSERTSKFSMGTNRNNKRGKPKEHQSSVDANTLQGVDNNKNLNMKTVSKAQRRESSIYKEAEKHLSEMLNIGDEDENLATRPVRLSFGRILSLPEYDKVSSNLSPGKNKVPGFVSGEIIYSPKKNFQSSSENIWWFKQGNIDHRLSPSRQNLESTNCGSSYNPGVEVQVPKSNPELSEAQESICVGGNSSAIGIMGIVEIKDTMCMEISNLLDVTQEPEAGPTTSTNHIIDVTERCGNEELFECSRLDSLEEKPQLGSPVPSFSVSPLFIHEIETPESISEKPERPSPVSVLESFFSEDSTSPASSVAKDAELAMPRRINFEEEDNSALRVTAPDINLRACMEDKESKFEYVRTVLKVSGFRCEEFKRMWHFSDQPLDSSLINEVETTSAQISEDRKLIFDCINEVLMEVYERYFSCSPWVSFIKPNPRPIPVGKNLVREVCEGIDWDLVPQFPCTLDQIIGKDIAKIGHWMDLRFEAECIGSDMEEAILEELMDETILELWT